jgi:DNA invertase Pin-like site-specific DNA recombinase
MNVVIYARYSSSKQNETSVEAQLNECYNFCNCNGYTVIEKYIDEAVSGKTDNRINFQKMIEDSEKRNFQGIVVYQLDRFARNRYDSATYKARLKKNGVKVFSAKENITDDASRNSSRICVRGNGRILFSRT